MDEMADEHQQGWHEELTGDTPPHWVYQLALHLRMVDLEHLSFRLEGFAVRAALYLRVSTLDQNPETQRRDLLTLAQQRGLEIVQEYVDHGVSGARTRRPALDRMMADATRHHFDVVLVWAGDRLARSVKHFLEVLDELNRLQIQFVSFRENLDTGGPLGRAVVIIVSAVAELEKSLIVERVRAGLRRARLEGRHIGRPSLQLDVLQICRDRERGLSLTNIAKAHRLSRTTVLRVLKQGVPKGSPQSPSQPADSTHLTPQC